MPLKTGDPLPEIPGVDWPAGPRIVYFYPRDFTRVCTRQARCFRDAYEELRRDFGAEVVGVSRDSEERHARFKAEERLPFRLVSDPKGAIARRFGVGRLWLLLPLAKRITFVADPAGVIRGVFHHELDAERHLTDVRACLESARRA